MALLPLKQTVTVARSNAYDGWGKPVLVPPVTLKARVTETTKTVMTNTGEEALTTLEIFLDKLADVSYDDTITYTDELGATVTRRPLKIERKRMLSSKAVLTVVYV